MAQSWLRDNQAAVKKKKKTCAQLIELTFPGTKDSCFGKLLVKFSKCFRVKIIHIIYHNDIIIIYLSLFIKISVNFGT